jgi:hypothetical protein
LNVAARIFHDRTEEDATISYSPATDLGKRVDTHKSLPLAKSSSTRIDTTAPMRAKA